MTTVVCVDPAHVRAIWPHVAHFVRAAIDRVGVSVFSEVADDILEGNYLLWIGWDNDKIVSALVTALYPDAVHIVAFAGRMQEIEFLPMIENYARDEGCSKLRITGRKGWCRVLKHWNQPYVVLEKDLE